MCFVCTPAQGGRPDRISGVCIIAMQRTWRWVAAALGVMGVTKLPHFEALKGLPWGDRLYPGFANKVVHRLRG